MVSLESLNNPACNIDLLYHFTSARVGIEELLFKKQIKFGPLSHTNDPLEFQDFYHVVVADSSELRSEVDKTVSKANEANRILKTKYRICCFTSDVHLKEELDYSIFDRGFSKSRMWSQYADSHKGICLVFSKVKFQTNIGTNPKSFDIPIETEFFLSSDFVSYSNDVTAIVKMLAIDHAEAKDKTAFEILEKNLGRYLYSKYRDYRDEQEFRVSLYSDYFKASESLYVNFADSLEAIILGSRFPVPYIENILRYEKELGVSVYQMDWYNGRPSVVGEWNT